MNRVYLYIIIGIGAILAVAGIGFGYHLDRQGFAANFAVSVAGLGMAICAGVILVDRLVESDRKRQWGKVRNFTLGAIASHLSDFGSDVSVFFPVTHLCTIDNITAGRNMPRDETAEGFKALTRELSQVKGDISERESPSDRTVEFYENAKWDLEQIQAVLTPRVIQSHAEQGLIDALIEFDRACRDLHNAIIGHKMVVTQGAFPALISTVEKAGELYSTLCRHWKTEPEKKT